jgi:RNA polymerase sigma factor (sigma-70 family)
MTQSSTTLVRRAIVGDEKAWEDLVIQYGGLLRAIARDFRLSQEQASDAAQNTWMRLVESIGKVREPEKLGGWLASTMRRECIRLINRRRGEHLTDDWAGHQFGQSASADVDVLLAERNELLWAAVEQLPARQRRLLVALATEPPPSYEEVGAELSMAIGSIGPTRQRALRRLRLLLAEAGVVEGMPAPPVVDDAELRPRMLMAVGGGGSTPL